MTATAARGTGRAATTRKATARRTTARTTKEDAKEAAQLAAATAVLQLQRSKPGFKKKLRSEDVVGDEDQEQGDRQLLHISQDLLDRKLLRSIRREDGRIRRYLETRAVSCSMLADGHWCIPLGVLEETDGELDQYIARRQALVDQLVDEKYEPAKQEARRTRGRHYNEADYPDKEALRAAFAVARRWISFNVPKALEGLSESIAAREMDRQRREWSEAGKEMEQALLESLAGLTTHMAEVLGQDDGKPRTFRDSTVEKMTDFLRTIGARNVTGSTAVADLAAKAQAVMDGVTGAQQLRDDLTVRERVRQGMEAVKAALATQVVVRTRKVSLDEEV